jgi:hypothetical protein
MPCHCRVSSGGQFTVSPGSLAARLALIKDSVSLAALKSEEIDSSRLSAGSISFSSQPEVSVPSHCSHRNDSPIYSGRTKYSAPAYHLRYNCKKPKFREFLFGKIKKEEFARRIF